METGHVPDAFTPTRSAFSSGFAPGSGMKELRFVFQCTLGVLGIVCAAALAHRFGWLLPAALLIDLAIVVLTAWLGGFWQALAVSLSAILVHTAFNARGRILQAAADPASSVTLVAFVLIALVVSRLSAHVRRTATEAESWGRQMSDLYEFTRRTLAMNLNIEPGQQLADLVQEIFSLEAVVIFDADLHQTYQAGYWRQDPQELAQSVYYFENSDDDPASGLGRRVLRLGNVPIGSLIVRGDTTPLTNNTIASLIATTFDRYRAFANESQIETERRTEQLRSTVLDSLAHAYKTPLTAIRVASTGLGEMGKLSPAQAELVSLIDEQAAVLNELTTRLLTTARLDAGEVSLQAEPVGVRSLVDDVVAGLKDRLASMKVAIHIEDEDLELKCDRQLIGSLLTQYIDNACKYSLYGTTISIRVTRSKSETIFSVHSFGPEIPTADRERIFDRFYRSANASHRAAGTGIGLAVAKRAAQMHGGQVWVSSSQSEGTTFFAAIPAAVLQRS